MIKKLIVGLLVFTLVGSAAVAFYDTQNTISANATSSNLARTDLTDATPSSATSASNVGQEWSASGTIQDLTTVGMTLALEDGSEIFVELGSPNYWQAQGVSLNAGAAVAVDGFYNGTNYHARTVTTTNGQVLAVRNENGQPLWAGGSGSGTGENGGQGQVQIPADQWVTVEGTVTALTNNGLILQTTDAQTLTVSFGRADFWQAQAITFAAGDAISMLGFWQGDQFSAGQVTKTATGERVLLRDPNGRPLWAGPGRGQGNGNGGSNSGNGAGNRGQHTSPASEATVTAGAGL